MKTQSEATGYERVPRSKTGRRRHIFRYRLTLGAVVVISGLVAVAAARLWPIHGFQIQAPFFLSLASSCLTLFGLVFTLCLIGTQFMAARTNIAVRRIFGPGTWLYLFLFVVAILWTLAISYRAGDGRNPKRICVAIAFVKPCFSEAQAGRTSIFEVTWSLLLLLPFILYVYRRLTVTYAFASIVTSALHARTLRAFRRRSERLTSEIVAVSGDATAFEEGLAYLSELGFSAVKRGRILRQSSAYSDAHIITTQFCSLGKIRAPYPELMPHVIREFKDWSSWLIYSSQKLKDEGSQSRVITRGQVKGLVRMAVDAATSTLRTWQISPIPMVSAQASVQLLQEVATACKSHQVRVSFSEASMELANCAVRKAIEGTEAEFKLATRGLISLVETIASAENINLGAGTALKSLGRLLADLGNTADDRFKIPPWVLNELHELADTLSRHYSPGQHGWTKYLASLSSLAPNETIAILRGPLDSQHQKRKHMHASWQSVVLEAVRISASQDVALTAQSTAIALWAKGDELGEIVNLFERLSNDYINCDGASTLPLLESAADDLRLGFQENSVIKESLWRRRLASELRTQRGHKEQRG